MSARHGTRIALGVSFRHVHLMVSRILPVTRWATFSALALLWMHTSEMAEAASRGTFTPEEDQIINEKWPRAIENPSGLRYVVLAEGTGERPRQRQRCRALYEGMLLDGTVFDKKLDPADPFVFVLGTNKVIQGWEEAFQDMRVGEKRLIILPHALGYGLRGRPPDIPNRAVLVFMVELLGID